MRKIISAIAAFAAVFSISLTAMAYSRHSGLFAASVYSDAYHVLFCRDVSKMGNRIRYYTSVEEAEADGKHPCHHCGKYIRIIRGDYTGTEAERELVDVYLEGYYAGEMAGNSKGYDQGYKNAEQKTESLCDAAYSEGYRDGEAEAQLLIDALKEEHSQKLSNVKESAWMWSILAIVFLVIPGTRAIVQNRDDASHRKQLQEARDHQASEIEALRQERDALNNAIITAENRLEVHKSGLDPESVKYIPDGVRVVSIPFPVRGRVSKNRPYGDYTVYTSPSGSRYHCQRGCGNATKPMHIFACPGSLPPCRNCVPMDMYPQPLPEWYLILTGQKKPSPALSDASENANRVTDPVHTGEIDSGSGPNSSYQAKLGPTPEEITIVKRSSAISAVCYKSGNLYIKTTWGEYLVFYRVPHPVYIDFMNAPSMGKFYRKHISGMYPSTKL